MITHHIRLIIKHPLHLSRQKIHINSTKSHKCILWVLQAIKISLKSLKFSLSNLHTNLTVTIYPACQRSNLRDNQLIKSYTKTSNSILKNNHQERLALLKVWTFLHQISWITRPTWLMNILKIMRDKRSNDDQYLLFCFRSVINL